MAYPSPGGQPADLQRDDCLDSWKEIAAYLKRDVTTVQRIADITRRLAH
jgi:hypothetical protein